MPDFNQLASKLNRNRQAETADNDPANQQPQMPQRKSTPNPVDFSGTSMIGNERAQQEAIDQGVGEQFDPNRTVSGRDQYVDPNAWSPSAINDAVGRNFEKNFLFGVGQMVGDYGDIAQVVGSLIPGIDMYEGNMVSRFLQEQGQNIQDNNELNLPPEVMDPNFSFKTLSNPDFWLTHGARFLPQLMEIVATMGVAGGAKKLVQKGVKGLAKGALENVEKNALKRIAGETVEDGIEKTAFGSLKATTKKAYDGAQKINEVKGSGSGLLGKIMTDRGKLTKSFGDTVSNVAGGVTTNLRVGLANAGEVYNTYKDVKDENGNPVFSKEELADMASSTFGNNMKYLGIDILSWGMTYGKGFSKAKGLSKVAKQIPTSKVYGAMASKTISPGMKKLASFGGKAVKEGFEETVQETWEEWSKMKAYDDVHGSLEGYQGKISENYDTKSAFGITGFYDYYMSKDSEATRVIAGAMGALGGSAFNIKTLVNKQADELQKMNSRSENFDQMYEDLSAGKQMQDYHIQAQMSELVFEGKGNVFVDFIGNLKEEGKITDEEFENYGQLFDEMAAASNDIKNMNVGNKRAFLYNVTKQNYFNREIEMNKLKTEEAILSLRKMFGDSEQDQEALAIAEEKELAAMRQRITPLTNMLTEIQDNKRKLIQGKKAKNIEFEQQEDIFGNTHYVQKKEQSGNAKNDSDVDVDTDAEVDPNAKGFVAKATAKGKELLSSVMSYFTGTEEDPAAAVENTTVNNQTAEPVQNQEPVEPADLAASVKEGDRITIDGQSATVTSVNENINKADGTRSIDSFDYEIDPDPERANTVTTQEEIDSRKGNARFTKSGKFFDDRTNSIKDVQPLQETAELDPDTNENIISDDDTTKITPEIFAEFTDNKKIPSGIINAIAQKLADNPDGSTLTDQEKDVRAAFNDEIETNLKERFDLENEIDEDFDTKEEAEYARKSLASKKKTKSEDQDTKEFLENLQKQQRTASSTIGDLPNSISGRERRAGAGVGFKSVAKQYIKNSKAGGLFQAFGNKFAGFGASFSRATDLSMKSASEDLMSLSQSMALNRKLETMFPDLKPRVYAVENMTVAIGKAPLGYTLAGAVYIDKNSWKQPRILMHEMSHIYFDLMKDDLNTQKMLDFALKNDALVDKVMKIYDDSIEYKMRIGTWPTFTDEEVANGKTQEYFTVTEDQVVTKASIIDNYESKTPAQREADIDKYKSLGIIRDVPLKDQSVIAEEAFAMALEGPLSEQFTVLFNPKDEPKRQFYAKRWWGKVKKRADDALDPFDKSQENYLKSFKDAEYEEYGTVKETIFAGFRNGIEGKVINSRGRAKAIEANQAYNANQVAAMRSKISKNIDTYLNVDPKKDYLDDMLDLEEQLDLLEDNAEDNAYENLIETNRLKYVAKASQVVRDFAKVYNKVQRRKFYNANKNKATNWAKIPYFDRNQLTSRLFDLAKQSGSSADFILKIKNSDVETLHEFNMFLDSTRADKEMFLQSMHYVYKNQSNINSVTSFQSKSGEFKVQNTLSNKEINTADNIIQNVRNAVASHYLNGKKTVKKADLDRFIRAKDSIDNIRRGDYTDADIYQVVKMFSTKDIDVKALIKQNTLIFDGKSYNLRSVVEGFVKSENGLFKKGRVGSTYETRVLDANGKTVSAVRPGIRAMAQAIVTTNRRNTANFTVTNAEGNQEPIRIIDNFMTREFANIKNDALSSMSKTAFLKKYSHVSGRAGVGSRSNSILNFLYDSINDGKDVGLSQFHGIKNDQLGNSSVMKSSNAIENSVNEFKSYLSTRSKKSYLMEMGRFSDSPRSFMLEVPKIDIDQLGSIQNKEFVFNTKAKGAYLNAFNVYKGLGGPLDQKGFGKVVASDVKKEIDFVNENYSSFVNTKFGQKYFNPKTKKLNREGMLAVAEYSINQSLNGIALSEILFPSFKLDNNDFIKRAKSGTSPGFALGKHVQVEPIYFMDEYLNGDNVTDAGMYVLEEDADRLERAGGNIMPLGRGYKLLQTGIEHYNEKFAGKNMYDKGYATILNEEYVKNNPKLKGLYELMKARRAKYQQLTEQDGGMEQDLLSGVPTHLLYAAPMSSNKSGNLPIKFKDKNGIATEAGQAFSLDAMTSAANNGNFDLNNKILDDFYYDNGELVGLSGDNMVVQQVMDKRSIYTNTPIQMVRAMITNAGVNGQLDQAEKMQRLIAEMQQDDIAEMKDIMENGTEEDIRNLLIKGMNLGLIDPLQRFQIEEGLSTSTPALREITKNTVSNMIRRAGNKLTTPGGVAQQKASMYEKPFNTNNSKSLAFYSQDNKTGGLKKGEAVVPMSMSADQIGNNNPNRIQKRKYLTINDKAFATSNANIGLEKSLAILKSQAEKEAKRRGVGIGLVQNDNGSTIGYYVEGDTIIATRIPSHGPQTTGVFEVVDFDTSGGSQVQLPTEFAVGTSGGDYDGDQVFIQHKGKGAKYDKWNEVMDLIEQHWLSPEMSEEVMQRIDFEEDAKVAIDQIEKVYGKFSESDYFQFSPEGRRKAYNNTMVSKGNVGITANLHGLIGILSAYDTPMSKAITINGVRKESFSDSATESRTINSAKIFNIILDNAKFGFADKLGFTKETISQAVILRNLGYSLGDIGVILNSPVVKEMNKILGNKSNAFSGYVNIENLESLVVDAVNSSDQYGGMTIEKNANGDLVVDTKNINDPENQSAVLSMMMYLSDMTNEINTVSKVMAGHKEIEPNPFVQQKDLDAFDKVLNNENKTFTMSDRAKANPTITNYRKVAQFNLETQQAIDPVSRKDIAEIYNSIDQSTSRNLTKEQQRKLHNDLEVFITSRLLGLNNVGAEYMKTLVEFGDNNIFDRLNEHYSMLQDRVIKRDENNPVNSVTAADNSLLFSQAINMNSYGNMKQISLNPGFFNDTISDQERTRAIEEFNFLPKELVNDLVIYDLFTNGWKGPKSLFHLFSPEIKQEISKAAQRDIQTKSVSNLKGETKQALHDEVIKSNSDFFAKVKFNPFIKTKDGYAVSKDLIKNKNIFSKIKRGEPVVFNFKMNKQDKIAEFTGFTISELKAARQLNDYGILQMSLSKIRTMTPNQSDDSISIVSIEDQTDNQPSNYWQNKIDNIKNSKEQTGRERRSDYYNFMENLSRKEFDDVMEYKPNTIENQKEIAYQNYLSEKAKANKVARDINSDTVKKKSDDQLYELFNEYSRENKFAFAKVLRPVILELAQRTASEQSKLTNKEYDGKDISPVKKWLLSNNVPSNHPAVQGMVRKMETEYKTFSKEKAAYNKRINDATNAIYEEKFGFKTTGNRSVKDILKGLYYSLFKDKKNFYDTLYGPLVKETEYINDQGVKVLDKSYKSPEEIQAGVDNGTISEAQKNFYDVTRAVSKELEPHVLEEGQKGRQNYIPHTAPSNLEAFSRRGLLGLMVNSKTIDDSINDVKMNYKNPITGELEKNVTFKEIKDTYNILSRSDKSKSGAIDLLKLKRKAIALSRKGKNEDGSDVRYSNIEMGSAYGDVFMDRFAKSRSVSATDMPSMDLNKAFLDYVHGGLFTHGNGKFQGFKKMLPVIDGVLAQADRRGDKNMSAYVDRIWKQYFLSGKKQSTIPNLKTLEAVGVSSDNVVDYITKGSLIYWLGYKGLAIGGGLYAIGNVLIGKYNNIANAGGKDWLKGEKRFWFGKSGKIDPLKPFEGIRESAEILSRIGFLDINVYDNISMENKNSFEKNAMNLALLPMIKTEKWIQGAHMLGMLSDEEWQSILDGNDLPVDRLTELENQVKISHGKGYQPTDQRMVQMYSWGRSMMQFSRYIPTMFYDKLGKEDIDIYGKKHMGSYVATWKTVQKLVTGQIDPRQFRTYYNDMDDSEKRRFNNGLISFGLIAGITAVNTFLPSEYGKKLSDDSMMVFDSERLTSKFNPAALNMFETLVK